MNSHQRRVAVLRHRLDEVRGVLFTLTTLRVHLEALLSEPVGTAEQERDTRHGWAVAKAEAVRELRELADLLEAGDEPDPGTVVQAVGR